jgi:predicted GNAT family N-acyltransferase
MLDTRTNAQIKVPGPENSAVNPSAQDAQEISIRRLQCDEIGRILELTSRHPELSIASETVIRRVLEHNPDSFWGVFRRPDVASEPSELEGYYAFLLLNENGDAALRARTLPRKDPPLEYLAKAGERAHSVYIWVMVAKGLSAAATPIVIRELGKTSAGAPLFASAATQAGLNLMRRQGFHPLTPADDEIGGLCVFGKLGNVKVRPLRAHRMESRFRVVVARTSEDIERAFAIRAAVFMMEQNCPYDEEFDGNDRTATHIIGYVDGEPAATLRIRYFADFVKIERLAVLPRFRRTLIAKEVVNTGIDFCRRKGYRQMYGHIQKRLLHFWSRFGFRPFETNHPLVFSDHEYIVVAGDLQPHDDPITMHSLPHVLIRPEGKWDEPGILEKSAERPPTNPH